MWITIHNCYVRNPHIRPAAGECFALAARVAMRSVKQVVRQTDRQLTYIVIIIS